jgi:hypothetical protein
MPKVKVAKTVVADGNVPEDLKGKSKVKNAKKVDENGRVINDLKQWKKDNPEGVYYDSTFELWVDRTLDMFQIKHTFKPEKLILVPSFITTDLEYTKELRSELLSGLRKAVGKSAKSAVTRNFNKNNKKSLIETKVLPETWSVDFYLEDYGIYLEAKGFANDGFDNKLKLARFLTQEKFKIVVVYTQKDLYDLISYLQTQNQTA